jgi:nicotinamidase-related amidase
MSLVKKIFITVLVVILAVVAFLFYEYKKMSAATTGPRISSYANPTEALLVIDVQDDYTGVSGRREPIFKDVDNQIAKINKLIDKASSSGMQVVYVRHLFSNNFITRNIIDRSIEGLPGTELDTRVKVVSTNDFTKKISDAFSNPNLSEFLAAHHVKDLYLTGLDGAYCVYKTALGGMNRGYDVTVVTDAVISRKKMEDVLKLYEENDVATITSDMLLVK